MPIQSGNKNFKLWPPQDPPPPAPTGVMLMIQPDPYVYLYAIDLPTSPPTKFRVTNFSRALTFERDSAGAAVLYSRFNVQHREIDENANAELTTTELSLQNSTLEGSALLQNYIGLTGMRVRIIEILLSDLPDGDPVHDDEFEVVESSAQNDVVTLKLGIFSLFNVLFPKRRIDDRGCWRKYGDDECGYDTTRVGALQTCDMTEDGPNGCIVHGLNEQAAGLPNRHPKRILMAKGVLRPR